MRFYREEIDIKEAFFPVEEKPMLYNLASENEFPVYAEVNNWKAIVDVENCYTFTCAKEDYLLVPNAVAYCLSEYLIKKVFKTAKLADFKCYDLTLGDNRQFMFMDLFRPEEMYQPHINNDGWIAFVKVVNSYNKSYPLSYSIGFRNESFSYEILFDDMSIEIKISKANLKYVLDIETYIRKEIEKSKIESIERLQEEFKFKMERLTQITYPKRQVFPMFCKIFGFQKNVKNVTLKKYAEAKKEIEALTDEYFKTYKKTAYAMMKVFVEYASRHNSQIDNTDYRLYAGRWINEIIKADQKNKDFSISDYIGKEWIDVADWIEKESEDDDD